LVPNIPAFLTTTRRPFLKFSSSLQARLLARPTIRIGPIR